MSIEITYCPIPSPQLLPQRCAADPSQLHPIPGHTPCVSGSEGPALSSALQPQQCHTEGLRVSGLCAGLCSQPEKGSCAAHVLWYRSAPHFCTTLLFAHPRQKCPQQLCFLHAGHAAASWACAGSDGTPIVCSPEHPSLPMQEGAFVDTYLCPALWWPWTRS